MTSVDESSDVGPRWLSEMRLQCPGDAQDTGIGFRRPP